MKFFMVSLQCQADIFKWMYVDGHGQTPYVQFNSPALHKASRKYTNLLSFRWCYHWQLCHNGTSPHIALETTPLHVLPLKGEETERGGEVNVNVN